MSNFLAYLENPDHLAMRLFSIKSFSRSVIFCPVQHPPLEATAKIRRSSFIPSFSMSSLSLLMYSGSDEAAVFSSFTSSGAFAFSFLGLGSSLPSMTALIAEYSKGKQSSRPYLFLASQHGLWVVYITRLPPCAFLLLVLSSSITYVL